MTERKQAVLRQSRPHHEVVPESARKKYLRKRNLHIMSSCITIEELSFSPFQAHCTGESQGLCAGGKGRIYIGVLHRYKRNV